MKFDFGHIRSRDYVQNEHRTGANRDGYEPCCVCGRAVARSNPRAFDVMVTDGGNVMTTEEDPDNPGWLGCWPVGADCAGKYPEIRPYLIRRDPLAMLNQKSTSMSISGKKS